MCNTPCQAAAWAYKLRPKCAPDVAAGSALAAYCVAPQAKDTCRQKPVNETCVAESSLRLVSVLSNCSLYCIRQQAGSSTSHCTSLILPILGPAGVSRQVQVFLQNSQPQSTKPVLPLAESVQCSAGISCLYIVNNVSRHKISEPASFRLAWAHMSGSRIISKADTALCALRIVLAQSGHLHCMQRGMALPCQA